MSDTLTTARLVTDRDAENVITINRECDARTALSRGIADYLREQTLGLPDGRLIKFENVFDNYADLEDGAKYPSAAVYAVEDGQYDGGTESPLSPSVDVIEQGKLEQTGEGYALVTTTELVQPLIVEVWATDTVERGGFGALLEDALTAPVDWMSGFTLELPFYFNLRAVYEPPSTISYVDNDGDRARRYYRLIIKLRGRISVARLKKYTRLDARTELKTT